MKTSSAFEALRLANPVPEPDVRLRPSRRRFYRAAAATALLAAILLLVAPAFGVRLTELDFWEAEEGPPKIVQNFEQMDVGAPEGMATNVIPGQTRKVGTFRYRGNARDLWVAPTRHGGFCTLWEKSGGGCDKLGTVPLDAGFWARSVPGDLSGRRGPIPPRLYDVVLGHVNGDYADSVEIRFADGRSVQPEVVWVSEPINAGFYAFEIPEERVIASVAALDEDGDVVTEAPAGHRDFDVPPRDALIEEKEAHTRIETAAGEAVLWVAPTRYEGECAWVEIDGQVRQFMNCLPKGYRAEPRAGFAFFRSGEAVFFVGEFDLRLSAVEFRSADGQTAVARPERGFLLHKLTEGKTVVELVFRNTDGKERFRVPVTQQMLKR
jgi:hypothetical protein